MRPTTNIKFKKISVTEEIHERLKTDRDEFEKVIGCGKWSISDTIKEYLKIINGFLYDAKEKELKAKKAKKARQKKSKELKAGKQK